MVEAALLIVTAYSVYASNKATSEANKAANAEMKARQVYRQREERNKRTALKQNTATRVYERDRQLAELRVNQAASGFANSGTQLAIFGEFKSRLNDQIDEATNQGLDQIANIKNQGAMDQFVTQNQISQRKYANRLNNISTGLQGATSAAGVYARQSQSFGSTTQGTGNSGSDNPFASF